MSRLIAFVALMVAALASVPAQAMTIERIVSPAGIEAWLVRESATPLVAMAYSFLGGSSQDPADKSGKCVAVTVKPVRRLASPVTLATIKADKAFATWELVK